MANGKQLFVPAALVMSMALAVGPGCSDELPGADPNDATAGCAAKQGGALGDASCQLAVPVTAASPEVQREMLNTMRAYVQALESSDFSAVQGLISAELRDRIDARGQGRTFSSKLQRFVSDERGKLMQNVEALQVIRRGSPTATTEMLADGSIAAISFSFDRTAPARPFYFVLEGERYKLNVVKPDIVIQEGNTYVIKNDDGVTRSFTCTGGSGNVAAGQTLNKFCSDACGWFDGTDFTVNGATASCDYNTWGIDMYIRNNSPVCAGRC